MRQSSGDDEVCREVREHHHLRGSFISLLQSSPLESKLLVFYVNRLSLFGSVCVPRGYLYRF
jgi:hypothetical protein